MRFWKLAAALGLLAVGGCSVLTGGSTSGAKPGASASAGADGKSWIWYAPGSATPSVAPSSSGSRKPALPPVSFLPLPPDGGCPYEWTVAPVEIPMQVTPGKGSLTVKWARQYDSDYRITAVRQPLKSGNQPNYLWQYVPTPAGCWVTATISGLQSGVPYIVWLDAPNTGYDSDGTRHPYSGRSGVVYPL
jgi:hypothetical protein